MSSNLTGIDLFCGAGGFSNGFENAGFDIKIGIDKNKKALKTFEKNHNSDIINRDIRDGVPDKLYGLDLDVIIGSPPCKGFSDARGSRYVDDNRNGLVFEYVHFISELQPDVAVMENVSGMRTIDDDFINGLKNAFSDIGYNFLEIYDFNSKEFGVPQSRDRVILIATRNTKIPDIGRNTKEKKLRTTVNESLCDLKSVSGSGEVDTDYKISDMNSVYSNYVRDLDDDDQLKNHRSKDINCDQIWKKVINRLEPGEMYRSTRFGNRYRQVWDILSDEFSDVQNECLKFIGNNRSKQDYRIRGKSVGHVNICKIRDELDYNKKIINGAIDDLLSNGWIRKHETDDLVGYDLNTKSGVRPRYMRLEPDSQSNTIMTTDFKAREKLHPYKNRGLSLREGARIQSFPDSFVFEGDFNDIASQIGNAVPPMMSYRIAKNLKNILK